MTRVWSGRTAGHGASGLTSLGVWLDQDGYATSRRLPDGQMAVVASTRNNRQSAGAAAGSRWELVGSAGLAAVVPPGFALLVDEGTPGRRVVSADVLDGLRVREPPDGSEPDFSAGRIPEHLRTTAERAVAAALSAGAARADAAWTRGSAREGLWVSVSRGPRTAAEAAFRAVEREAPSEAVRVLDADELDGAVRTSYFEGVARDLAGPDAPAPQPFSTRQNVLIVVVCLFGALLVALGREVDGGVSTAMQTAGWAVEALLLVVVLGAASGRGFAMPGAPRPGSGDRWRPLPVLGCGLVAAGLLWQAVRGLG